MTDLPRREASLPLITIAADARLSQTDYTDDQSWDVLPGAGDSPALALQTRLGGRAGLVSIVPMWTLDGRTVYQANGYHTPPTVTGFAPGYARLLGKLTADITVRAEAWCMDSHAIGCRYTLSNGGAMDVSLRLDVFAHAIVKDKAVKMAIVTLAEDGIAGNNALSLGTIANLQPAVMVSGGTVSTTGGSAKVGATVTIPANGTATVTWVYGGRIDLRDSLALAQSWLAVDWDSHLSRIAETATALPAIASGDDDLDLLLAVTAHESVQAFVRAGNALPHPSFVMTRWSAHGFSPAGDGSDHERSWAGQAPVHAYPLTRAIATIEPAWAKGVIRNYLAAQRDDGTVDLRPGIAGQRQDMAATPLLARLAWEVSVLTGDDDFIAEVYPGLARFFQMWNSRPHLTWDSERQTGYGFFPTFGTNSTWAQNADIQTVQSPELVAYLLSEALALAEMAALMGNNADEANFQGDADALRETLNAMWQTDSARYAYRDRDTHLTTPGLTLLDEGRADEEHFISQNLDEPARIIVRVDGGTGRKPRLALTLSGVDTDGNTVNEAVSADDFPWYNGYGVYTSIRPFRQLDRVALDGLSRVYRVTVTTLDTSRQDINGLLPLWSDAAHANDLLATLTDTARFLAVNGVTTTAKTDPDYDPAHRRGSGGVSMFWNTLLAEGLLAAGQPDAARDLFRRMTTAPAALLRSTGRFAEFYHSDQPEGLGETGHLGGAAPLALFLKLAGVAVRSPREVWLTAFHWDAPVTVNQHGVTVTRSADATTVTFPSGHTVEVAADTTDTIITDPTAPAADPPPSTVTTPEVPQAEQTVSGKVLIQVEIEEE